MQLDGMAKSCMKITTSTFLDKIVEVSMDDKPGSVST